MIRGKWCAWGCVCVCGGAWGGGWVVILLCKKKAAFGLNRTSENDALFLKGGGTVEVSGVNNRNPRVLVSE